MADTAKLTLHPEFTISEIDPRLYGSFIEHLGRAIYGGLYEPDHPSADKNGFRTDVLDLVRDIGVPVVRYPGGNFVSGYNWEDGIGPKEQRPRRLELGLAHVETNQFGTDEFVDWCRAAGTEPMMAVNLGTRGLDVARNLVEYCNHPDGTTGAICAARTAMPSPTTSSSGAWATRWTAPGRSATRPPMNTVASPPNPPRLCAGSTHRIELVACGSSNRAMTTFAELGGHGTRTHLRFRGLSLAAHLLRQHGDDTPNFLAKSLDMDRYISSVVSICDYVKARRSAAKKDVHLSFDEWNVWFHTRESDRQIEPWQVAPPLLEDAYTFEDALVVGAMLITLMKHADRVKIGCQAQLVNVIAPIMTATGGRRGGRQSSIPYLHAARYGQGIALDVRVNSPTYDDHEFGAVPFLESVAVWDEENDTLTIFAVNRDLKSQLPIEVDARAFADYRVLEHIVLTHRNMKAVNTQSNPANVVPATVLGASMDDGKLTAGLAPASWNVIRIGK